MSSSGQSQFKLLARRSLVRTLRDPTFLAPALIIPIVLYLVIAAGLDRITNIPGFPTQSFETFALTIAFVQGAMLAITNAGSSIAADVESGFINRLALTPMRGFALILAQLVGPLALGVIQAAAFLGVGLAAGARFEAGPAGAAVLVGLFLAAICGFGALGIFVGLRTASSQALQAALPLTTVLLFLSSANMPRDLMETDWFRWIATGNPLSYLVEGMRSVLVFGWDRQALALGFAVAAALTVLMIFLATVQLRRRLVRT